MDYKVLNYSLTNLICMNEEWMSNFDEEEGCMGMKVSRKVSRKITLGGFGGWWLWIVEALYWNTKLVPSLRNQVQEFF